MLVAEHKVVKRGLETAVAIEVEFIYEAVCAPIKQRKFLSPVYIRNTSSSASLSCFVYVDLDREGEK